MIDVVPAAADRWEDVERAVRHGDGASCWCQWYWMSSGEFSAATVAERRDRLRAMVRRDVAPGVIAYVAGTPAGWCGFGPRPDLRRLERSRTIPKVDDAPAWSIFCFLVRREHRGCGLAGALLEGAIGYIREAGASLIEAYPVDNRGERLSAATAYVGTLSLFTAHGFEVVAPTTARTQGLPRVVVRLTL
jgi:GNAT superfamily N-acetyltransferase